MKGPARAYATAAIAALLAAALAALAILQYVERSRAEERSRVSSALAAARDRLDGELQRLLAVPEAVAVVAAAPENLDPGATNAALARIVESSRHLRRMELVPDAPDAAPSGARTVLSAPFRLPGGGLGFNTRSPVVRGSQARGVITTLVSADSLFEAAGFRRPERNDPYELALRGRAGSGSSWSFVSGSEAAFASDPVLLDYTVPGGGRWELGAIPAGGWTAGSRVAPWAVALAVLATMLAGLVTYRQVRARQRAADRMRFIEDLFESVPAALAMRDLQGRYMYVNRTWEKMFNAKREVVIGKHVRERVPEMADQLLALDRVALERGSGTFLDQHDVVLRGRHLSQARSVMTDAYGQPIGIVIANIDTTDHFVLRQKLADQAKQLEAQNEALKENVRLREEVERIGRHDLKTPLNSILAAPRLLREGRNLTREELDLLNIVERAGYRILNMVNLSLDLFKMEQGTYTFTPHPVDLMDVVSKVMVDVMGHAEAKGVTLKTVINGRSSSVQGPVYAWGDELLCYSMLGNLVKNAIEATPEGGNVTISLEGPRDVIMVRIHNPGVVPEAVRASFFEKYASSGKVEGTGLGTYSARLMARTQGGDISMRTSEESGTTLAIWLRAVPASAMPSPADRPREERRASTLAALGTLHVLVVDDDEFNRLIVRRYLPPPVRLDTAVNGKAAVEAAAASPPAAILMDLDMPVMDGYEAVRNIRADEAASGRPRAAIIALSSHDDDETRARCLAGGFDFYLTKPVTRELLHETLARFAGISTAAPAPETIAVDDDVRDMIPGFLASRREIAAQLAEAAARGDREELRRAAHKLAGSFALYGFHWASDCSRALERDAMTGDLARLAERIARLREHLETIVIAA